VNRPIPDHLWDILVPRGAAESETEVTGTLRCTCGGEEFAVLESNERRIVRAVCRQCGREAVLFDAGKHGWDGFVCGFDPLDRTEIAEKFRCPVCGGEHYAVTVHIASQGKADFVRFLKESESSFTEEDWVNAFEWITVSLRCTNCGRRDSRWLDCETM